ncbi:MAG: MFS transporter [Chloroflexota bacterium]
MDPKIEGSLWRVVIPASLGTGLSLMGDTSLYAVLPTHTAVAGVSVASIGILLSANRIIRLFLNGPMGMAYDRWPRRYLFVTSLFIGALSTAIYALTQGFWPLLVGRLLWGLAWAGIWVGGNTIILDITNHRNRGRWVGIYHASFFLGAAAGASVGGFLTDWVGYHAAMGISATLTLVGAIIALIFLPETRHFRQIDINETATEEPEPEQPHSSHSIFEMVSAISLLGVNRLIIAGFLLSTFGLFLFEQFGESVEIGGIIFGTTTLTGLGLGVNSIISMLVIPLMGRWSDQTTSRWYVAAIGLVPGVIGLGLVAIALPTTILLGLPIVAIAGGSSQGLSTALVGDLSAEKQRGRQLGILYTVGDLTSAIAPPLAYSFMIPRFGIQSLYLFGGAIYSLMLLTAWYWAVQSKQKQA